MHGIPFLGNFKGSTRDYVYGARDRLDEIVERQTAVRDDRYRFVKNYLPEKSGYMQVLSRLQMPMMQNMLERSEKGTLNKEVQRWFDKPRDKEEFYDVDNDPHEMHNLVNDPRYAAHINKLRKKLQELDKKYNPYLGMTEAELREQLWRGGTQPDVMAPVFSILPSGLLKIDSKTIGASIAYRVNGKGFNKEHWLLYNQPIKIKKGDVITATATRIGYKQSGVIEFVIK